MSGSLQYIYVDVLIILNIYVNYFLIKATSRFTHTLLKTGRCILASVFGSLFSLLIFVPEINYFLNLAIKLAAAVLIVLIAFEINELRQLMKLVMYFYLINFAFAGIMFAMYFIFKPAFMHTNNSFFYIDFSLLTLVVCTIISYAVICLVRFVMDKSRTDGGKYTVIIKRGGRIISLDAISDTGNELYDSFSGRSVIVCGLKKLSDLFEDGEIADCNFDFEESFDMPKGFRLIPFSTISDCGIMPVFKPDEVIIKEENSNKIKKVDALIGINRKSTEAIFNPKLLNI